MQLNLSLAKIYWNPSVENFLFRSQSKESFEQTVKEFCNDEQSQRDLFNLLESMFDNFDDMEEFFYENSIEEIKEQLNEFVGEDIF